MEQRLGDSWCMTINERKFIEHALLSELRVDGRRPFDYRQLTIKFGSEDGSAEVQLGQTHIMAFVTSQLVQPYRDRPNEGTLSIFTEFSPMADPSFEPGRPGEFAVELGRIIDRGLRESRAIDMESLCVLAGKLVWAIRVDLHILDNGGNLVDAANVAALAGLLTFRRPECTLGGDDGKEVTVHPPEVKEPLSLIIHHLPVAVTFAFFGSGNILVVDPTHNEEAIMGGRMTATVNTGGDVCAIQKAGGEGVMQSVVMQCMRVASLKADDITSKIKEAVEAYNMERALRNVKRHSSMVAVEVDGLDVKLKERRDPYVLNEIGKSLEHHERLKNEVDERCGKKDDVKIGTFSSQQEANRSGENVKSHSLALSNWDPYSKGISPDFLRSFQASTGPLSSNKGKNKAGNLEKTNESKSEKPAVESNAFGSAPVEASDMRQKSSKKSLVDAVKPKNRRKK